MATSTLRLPKKIGSYEVKEVLGKGAMGEVFLGVHETLERPVALKRKLPEVDSGAISDKEAEERFLREAKVLARLKHHNIVAIHDFFTHRESMYMVLEYVDGFNLAEMIKFGPLPPDIVAIVAHRVAEALEYAHFHRVIHRDIKASNVMVSKEGDVKLMDFGIARDEKKNELLTQTGVVVGTPMYLAPELLAGDVADERTDIYAVGVLLYQCLSGRRLFEGASGDAIFPLILAGKYPKLSRITANIPRGLIKIVERCLARKREKRFKSATEVRLAVEKFITTNYQLANHAARLIGYLQAKGKLTEEESGTWIDASQLVVSDTSEVYQKRSPYRLLVLAAMIVFGVAAYYFFLGELR